MNESSNAPKSLGLQASFGFGDRTGLATAGHLEAIQRSGGDIAPIFAQQSIREMARTSRTPSDVMNDAMAAVDAFGWSDAHGADADHLKTREDIERTAAPGFTFFTIDPSDAVDQQADDYDEPTLRERFSTIGNNADWFEEYG